MNDRRKTSRICPKDQKRQILQQITHTDRRDQHRQRGRRLSERTICKPFNDESKHCTYYHRHGNCHINRQSDLIEHDKCRIRADHNDVTMRKIQHFCYAVYHCITKCNDRIYTAKTDTIDKRS